MKDAVNPVSRKDRDAKNASQAQPVDAVLAALSLEAIARHRVGTEHALSRLEHMVDDGFRCI